MLKKTKLLVGIGLILFSIVSLAIFILNVLDMISNETAKEAFLKAGYIYGAIFIVSLFILLIVKIVEDKK